MRVRESIESAAYVACIVVLQIAYVVGAALGPSRYFGFNQLRHIGVPGTLLALAGIWVAVWLLARVSGRLSKHLPRRVGPADRPVVAALVVACFGIGVFLILRSHAPNPDGIALLEKIPRDVASIGSHVTHDEMLELYLHSRVYHYANGLLGWSVAQVYAVVSAVAGGIYLFILVLLANQAAPASRFGFVGLALSGGYVQLFFGEIENYTMVATMILIYLAVAHLYVRRRAPLWAASGALSLAIAFHLLAGWLLPSLGYLFLLSKKRSEVRSIGGGILGLTLPLAAALAFLHFHGLPIQRLLDSSHVSGMGGNYARYLAPLQLEYHGGIVNVLALLLPAVFMLPALAYFGRLGRDPYSRFLQIGTFSMLLFAFIWRAQLGVYEDWSLFAPGLVPAALLVSRSFFLDSRAGGWRIAAALMLTGSLHTLLWILSNHFRWS